MSRNPLTADELLEVLEADNEHKSRHDAAKSLGLSYATFNARLYCARERLPDLTKEPEFEVPDLPSEELPIEELIEYKRKRFRTRKKATDAHEWIDVKVNIDGPVGILWMGDPHIDDNHCDWEKLYSDVELIKSNPAIKGASIGDVHNNWIGRLSLKMSPSQETTDSQTYMLIEWLINNMDPLILIRGNHDNWTPSAKDPMTWMEQPKNISADWQVKFRLNFPNGYSLSVDARHDFPGHSQYSNLHGLMKASLWNSDADLYVAGHKHNWGIQKVEQVNGKVSSLVRLRGYKYHDQYAIDKGFHQQQHGQSILQVIDPYSASVSKQLMFENVEEGRDYLEFLQKKSR